MSVRRWFNEQGLGWQDVVMGAILVGLVILGVYVARTCAASHGGHWWCWV